MANSEMRSSLKRWISAVACFFACVRACALAGFACVDGMGAVCGEPHVDVEVEPCSTFAFGHGFSALSRFCLRAWGRLRFASVRAWGLRGGGDPP